MQVHLGQCYAFGGWIYLHASWIASPGNQTRHESTAPHAWNISYANQNKIRLRKSVSSVAATCPVLRQDCCKQVFRSWRSDRTEYRMQKWDNRRFWRCPSICSCIVYYGMNACSKHNENRLSHHIPNWSPCRGNHLKAWLKSVISRFMGRVLFFQGHGE